MSEPTLQVRYGTFSRGVEEQPWRDCVEAEVEGEVLAIKWDANTLEWIPLHVIRGPIQVRKKPDPADHPPRHGYSGDDCTDACAAPSTSEGPTP